MLLGLLGAQLKVLGHHLPEWEEEAAEASRFDEKESPFMQGSDQRREIRGPGKINLVFCPRRQSLVARSRNGYSVRVVATDSDIV